MPRGRLSAVPRGGEKMRTVCCVCRRVKCKGDWLEQMVEAEVRVSHGFCPECFDKTMIQFSLAWSNRTDGTARAEAIVSR